MDQEVGVQPVSVEPTSRRENYETGGPAWSERAGAGELSAVLDPSGTRERNLFLHHTGLAAAKFAVRRYAPRPRHADLVLDYGCGTGRFIRFLGRRGYRVIGMDITPEMLAEADRFGLPPGCETKLADGSSLDLPDASVDFIWVCGVLKYSLLPPGVPCRGGEPTSVAADEEFTPTYGRIASEMFRVLKPGCRVANLEMYVDLPPDPFVPGFQEAGFVKERIDVVRRENGRFERLDADRATKSMIPIRAAAAVWIRRMCDDPDRELVGFRDYLFVWRKP